MKNLLVVVLILFCWVKPAFAQEAQYTQPVFKENSPPSIGELMSVEETFRYKIKYGFFTVGWVDVSIGGDSLINGRRAWHLKSKVTTNKSIPFVEEDISLFNSWMVEADSVFYSHRFWYDDLDANKMKEDLYIFDRQANKVYMKHKTEPADTLDLREPASSGHIIFYFSRLFAGENRHFEIPVYMIEEGLGKLFMDFTSSGEERSYDPFDHKITTYYAEGTSTIKGPFGMNGDFEAWYANDDLRIPLEAHVNVFIGNVKIKLIEYSRKERKKPNKDGEQNTSN